MSIEKVARLLCWDAGETPGPWRITLFPTYRCNIDCLVCEKHWVDSPPELLNELPDERWLKLVDEGAALGVREWVIGGGGEPMLRRDLVMEMIKRIRAYGANGFLQTNGTRFREQDLATLAEVGWNTVNISIDGPTEEINDAVRVKRDFHDATKAVRKLHAAKLKYDSPNPTINVVTILTSLVYDKIIDMVNLTQELGGNSFTLLSLITYNDELIQKFAMTPAQHAELELHVRRAKARADELGMENNLESFLPEGAFNIKREIAAPGEAPIVAPRVSESMCYEPWLSLSIVSSGRTSPCCMFWEYTSDCLRDATLEEVWLGGYLGKMRRDILAGTPPEACSRCSTLLTREHEHLKLVKNRFSAAPGNVFAKAANSLRTHGVLKSFQRGREWLQLRHTLKQNSPRA